MPALGANTARGRRIDPVEGEEGGEGGVQLCAALSETIVPAGVTVQGPAHHCNACRRIAVRSLHKYISLFGKMRDEGRIARSSRYMCFTHRAPQAFVPKNEALRRWIGRCLPAELSADAKQRLLPGGLAGPAACG
jgi:hypothetical protein